MIYICKLSRLFCGEYIMEAREETKKSVKRLSQLSTKDMLAVWG